MKRLDRRARAVVAAARQNYRYYPNVCGVSFGSKFSDGVRQRDTKAVQFFVTRKLEDKDLRRSLPKDVYSRRVDGSLDRSKKIKTDVIALEDLELCCAAGEKLDRNGGTGAIGLIFQNKGSEPGTFVVTCSHVVGEMRQSPSNHQLVGGNQHCMVVADPVGNSVLTVNDHVEFDIAIARLNEMSDPAPEGRVDDSATLLVRFAEPDDLSPTTRLDCRFPESGERSLTVESSETAIEAIRTPSGEAISVGNLYLCRGNPIPGDSGAVVFREDRLVGFVVARAANGWALIHHFGDALEWISNQLGLDLVCFQHSSSTG